MLFNDDPMEEDDFETGMRMPVEEKSCGLTEPRRMTDCIGHEANERHLLALIRENRLPHALIFSGPEGIGKATMAFRLTRFLLKRPENASPSGSLFGDALPQISSPETLHVAPEDPVFRQVAAGGHPDLLTVERPFDERKNRRQAGIPVEEARKIAPFMRMTAAHDGGWRVAAIDDADTMNRNAQNAILKILEEPPPRALLILVAHRTGVLLPTIRSRCRILNFMPPSPDVFAQTIRREHPDMDDAVLGKLYALSGASTGRALRFLQEEAVDMANRISALLVSVMEEKPDWPGIHGLAEQFAPQGQEERLLVFRDMFMGIAESAVRAAAAGSNRISFLPLDRTSVWPLAVWLDLHENLKQHFETAIRSSLDRRFAVMGAFQIFTARQRA